MKGLLAVLFFFAAVVLSLPASAQTARRLAAPLPSATPMAETPQGETPDSVTSQTVTIGGQAYAYTARAGTITLRNEREQPTANVFYTAYTVDGGSNRPVTFIYNGGPGSSTMWLRMGSIGPVRVQAADGTASGPPPYRINENPYSLLDKSDLVFIDMPDSGFGRILPAGNNKMFFGVDQDVAAFGQFIQRYITKFNRWNSPKFLFGESYGTTRSAALADYLLHQGVSLNGVVLVSSILSFGLDYGNGAPIGGDDWAYVLYLPTEAATAWYHGKIPGKPDLASFLHQAESFALGDYLQALYAGDRMSTAQRAGVVSRLSYFLGVPQQYVIDAHLRVPYTTFEQELLRGQDVIVGRLDSRFQTYTLDQAANNQNGPPWDPTDSSIDAPFTTAINVYLRDYLHYDTPLQYRPNIYGIIYANGSSWDFSHNRREPANVAPDLAEAMTQNPSLKVFSANGYYDFATPYFATVYTLRHLNIAPALQRNISFGFYQSGHMVYLNQTALAQFKADLARFYDDATGGR